MLQDDMELVGGDVIKVGVFGYGTIGKRVADAQSSKEIAPLS
jgi:phosphoglycerate dehydrogenase-like enzyme